MNQLASDGHCLILVWRIHLRDQSLCNLRLYKASGYGQQLRFRLHGQYNDVDPFRVSFASCAGCVGYLGGDHPHREICSHDDVLSQGACLSGLAVNDSCPQAWRRNSTLSTGETKKMEERRCLCGHTWEQHDSKTRGCMHVTTVPSRAKKQYGRGHNNYITCDCKRWRPAKGKQ